MSNDEWWNRFALPISKIRKKEFLNSTFVIRHSAFGIRHSAFDKFGCQVSGFGCQETEVLISPVKPGALYDIGTEKE